MFSIARKLILFAVKTHHLLCDLQEDLCRLFELLFSEIKAGNK